MTIVLTYIISLITPFKQVRLQLTCRLGSFTGARRLPSTVVHSKVVHDFSLSAGHIVEDDPKEHEHANDEQHHSNRLGNGHLAKSLIFSSNGITSGMSVLRIVEGSMGVVYKRAEGLDMNTATTRMPYACYSYCRSCSYYCPSRLLRKKSGREESKQKERERERERKNKKSTSACSFK